MDSSICIFIVSVDAIAEELETVRAQKSQRWGGDVKCVLQPARSGNSLEFLLPAKRSVSDSAECGITRRLGNPNFKGFPDA